jgi:hypothetical protein
MTGAFSVLLLLMSTATLMLTALEHLVEETKLGISP